MRVVVVEVLRERCKHFPILVPPPLRAHQITGHDQVATRAAPPSMLIPLLKKWSFVRGLIAVPARCYTSSYVGSSLIMRLR